MTRENRSEGKNAVLVLGCPQVPVQTGIALYLISLLRKKGVKPVVAGNRAARLLVEVSDPERHYIGEVMDFDRYIDDIAEKKRHFDYHYIFIHNDAGVSYAATVQASGSGFVIRHDGWIVTNAHVVDDAERIQVRLADGRRFEARLVGQDERVDLALLKVEASGLPVAALGDSNRARVGEFVLALGHPFGLEQTVSFGIVSRKGAPLQVAAPGFDFIQTDAAVNSGNSGGPLVNMAGEVIGVNSMAARNGSIGFAIPVNLVKGLLPQLASKGKVEWGWLGVGIAEIADEDVGKYGLKEPRGVLIRNVIAGEPADQAGVKADDVVLGVDGKDVEGPRDLQRIISSTPVGQTVKLLVVRSGKGTVDRQGRGATALRSRDVRGRPLRTPSIAGSYVL